MTDWGGWTGSLNARVRREIRKHFRDNALARRARYPRPTRLLHGIYDNGTFGRFIALYTAVALLAGLAELALSTYMPSELPRWSGSADIRPLLTNVAGYVITAQVGVLSIVSIAIGLVTIIAQRENASTDVQVYYHESLAFGVVASSIALLAVLCVQLLWPIQFAVHWFAGGAETHFFRLFLSVVHVAWLLLNLSGMAHFVATTLGFVQRSARERLRERYTTNVVLPVEMERRLREQLYLGAGPGLVREFCPAEEAEQSEATIYLGTDLGGAGDVEIALKPSKRLVLRDVRMAWVRWAVGRWLVRCQASHGDQANLPARPAWSGPLLIFPPRLDNTADVRAGLCRRRGGPPLTRRERLALRCAFKFRRMRDEA